MASHYTNKDKAETSLFNFLFIEIEEMLLDVDERMGGKTESTVHKEGFHFFHTTYYLSEKVYNISFKTGLALHFVKYILALLGLFLIEQSNPKY